MKGDIVSKPPFLSGLAFVVQWAVFWTAASGLEINQSTIWLFSA